MDGLAPERIGGDSATIRITWWGHSTLCVEDSGVRLLTDPVITDRVAHLRRRRGSSPTADDLGELDAVLVSHLHADHLHLPSLRRIVGDATTVVLPPGGARFVRTALGVRFAPRCVELGVGEEVRIDAVRVRAVPAAHDGRRGPWSRHRAEAVGYLVDGAAITWFAGDTGLFPGMAELGPVDLALVPVGGWGPSLGPGHLDAAFAAEAVRRAAAACAVPVHFGTFWPIGCDRVRPDMFFGPGEEFATLADTVAPDTRVEVLAPGHSLAYERAGSL